MPSPGSLSCWAIARTTLVDYSNNSSIHGVNYIGEKKRTYGERFLWSVLLLLMVVSCHKLIFDVYLKWTENPVIVSFANQPTPIWHIPFPAVTICPETKAKSSILNITEMYHRFANNSKLLYDLNKTEFSQMTAISQVCDPKVFGKIDPKNLTTCAKCVNELRQSRDKFREIVTEEGVCYTFNGIKVHRKNQSAEKTWTLETGYLTTLMKTNPRRAIGTGADYSLDLYLRLCTSDFDYICRNSAQGFKLLLHIPSEVPQISKHFYRIPFKQDVVVVIKPQMVTTSKSLRPYSPSKRHCYFEGERYLHYFKEYTQRNCELECFANYTILECGCTMFNMPRINNQTKVCGAGKIYCIKDARMKFSSDKCGCLPSCSFISYDAEISQAESNSYNFLEAQQDKTYGLDSCPITQITIYFKEERFISLERTEFYGKTDFLSNCGGLLGLFLGISLMSLLEIVYFCSVRLLGSFQMHQQRMKSKPPPIFWVKPVEFKSD